MPCPQSTEYNEAIQNLHACVSDEELRQGQTAVNALGLPLAWSGNFADVYKVHCPATGNTWAVKCFTREVAGLRDRYREISSHLQGARLPFMVDFRYVEPGIRIGRQWYPFLKMRWVEGLSLDRFVGDYLGKPKTLGLLLRLWAKLAVRLRQARVAHADLQHGNVLLVPVPKTGQFSLKLIDYDGMYVPSLARSRSGEVGHPAYQHPQRLREGICNSEVDRFSHLAIYAAVHCLTIGKRALWARFDNGDNLLFREVDFQSPGTSDVFQHLWALPDPEAHALIGHLILATQRPLDRVPLLSEVVSNESVRRLSHDEQQRVKSVMDRGASRVRPAARFAPEVLPWWSEPPPSEKKPVKPLSREELASSWGTMLTPPPTTTSRQETWQIGRKITSAFDASSPPHPPRERQPVRRPIRRPPPPLTPSPQPPPVPPTAWPAPVPVPVQVPPARSPFATRPAQGIGWRLGLLAVFLFIEGGMNLLMVVVLMIEAAQDETAPPGIGFFMLLAFGLPGLIMIAGAVNIWLRKSMTVAKTGLALSAIPCCSVCCMYIVALPVCVWGMKLLSDPQVQSMFSDRGPGRVR